VSVFYLIVSWYAAGINLISDTKELNNLAWTF